MKLEVIIGKAITNIYCLSGAMDELLESATCYIELDSHLIIRIPEGYSTEVIVCELPADAGTIFGNFEDYPSYHINKEKKSIGEISDRYNRRKKNIFNRIRKALFGYKVAMDEYQPYRIEYKENKMKHILNRKIIDILWFEDEKEKGYLLLDNGYIITEKLVAPPGIGAGLYFYESLEEIEQLKRSHCIKFTESR